MSGKPRKRSLTIAGHRTSISIEDVFWQALKEVAAAEGRSTTALIAEIDAGRSAAGLSSAIRCYVLNHYRRRAHSDQAV